MIVICTKCQAKFRVADEKIGPCGARVRCSRCQTVFHVHGEVGVVPSPGASDAVAERPGWTAPRAEARAAPSPPPLPPPLPPAPPPSDDPFAFTAPAPDPFAGTDPFAPPAPARSSASLAVTDLSDLLGGAPPRPPDPSQPAAFLPPPPSPAPPDDGGLALEERLTPPPLKVVLPPEPEPPLEVAGPQSFDAAAGGDRAGGAGPPFDPAAFVYAGEAGGEPLALAERPAPRDRPQEAPRRAAPAAAPAGRAEPAPAAIAAERPARRRTSRVRAVVVNALALAALLFVALGMLALWRGEGSIDLAALRPSRLLEAARGDGAASGPFATSDVRSGLYERARGAPLLFVRGTVRSRSPRPVPSVIVSVAVVRAGEVLARGEAIAGAMPTPEELHAASDGEALARAMAAARARAPSQVKPGDAVPFLVAIGDAPGDLEGAAIRVEAAPAGSRSR